MHALYASSSEYSGAPKCDAFSNPSLCRESISSGCSFHASDMTVSDGSLVRICIGPGAIVAAEKCHCKLETQPASIKTLPLAGI